jgi:alpha-glucosidase (family GH31 glycosyl hydrolase)
MRARGPLLAVGIALFVACDESFPTETPMVLSSPSARVEVYLRPFALGVYDKNGALVAETLKDRSPDDPNGTIAATFDAGKDGVGALDGWDGYQPLEGAWDHANEALLLAHDDAHASVSMQTDNGRIDVDISIDGNKVTIHQSATGHLAGDEKSVWNKTTMAWKLRSSDHFFGLGERFATMDHRGWSLYSWAEEGGLSRGEDVPPSSVAPPNPEPNGPSMTYFPVPFVLTPQGWGIHLDTTRRTETHFGSERDDAWRVAINGNVLDTVFYVNDDPMKSIDDFTRDTGRPHVPAPWVFGPRRRVSMGQQASFPPGSPPQDEFKLLRDNGVATTTLDDATHFLPHNSQVGREGDLMSWTSTLHANGYKATCYNTPYVSADDPNAAALYQEGTAKKYFMIDSATGMPGTVQFGSGKIQHVSEIDLTNPDAVTWFQNLLKRSLALGYDGWMHDFGEYTRRGWTSFDGSTGESLHNRFPVLSAKAAHDMLEVERPNDYLFYVRSGYTGSNQYASTGWSGDPEATFDLVQGLPAMVRGGLNLGMSGFPIWGSDTSGYKCFTAAARDKDVYLRWAQFSAVCPIMEEENACSNILDPTTQKWKLWNDQETVTVVGAMQRLHTRLQPYFMLLANQAHETGAPIMRHPMLMFPKETSAYTIDDAFFVGPSLYASPVVHRATTSKSTWMPPGRYVALDDSSVLEGGKVVTFPAPLDRLPLFVVENQMVPMLDPSIDTLAPAPAPGVVSPDKVADRLDVVVALGAGGHAAITMADGTTLTADRGTPQGNQSNLATVTADQVASCSGCVVVNAEGGVSRVRVTTPLLTTSNITYDDVTLIASGPTARRVRWDVRRLP